MSLFVCNKTGIIMMLIRQFSGRRHNKWMVDRTVITLDVFDIYTKHRNGSALRFTLDYMLLPLELWLIACTKGVLWGVFTRSNNLCGYN